MKRIRNLFRRARALKPAQTFAIAYRVFIAVAAVLYVVSSHANDAKISRQNGELAAQNDRIEVTNKRLERTVRILKQAIAEDEATRAENRVTACEVQRRDQLAINAAVDAAVGSYQATEDLVRTVFTFNEQNRTAEERAGARVLIDQLNAPIEKSKQDALSKKVEVRGCDPSDIAAYYGNPPPPDDVPCDSDGKGFCR